jgi:hypothetical protein
MHSNNKITSGATNQQDHKLRTFINKLLYKELPTMSRLNNRRPDLYPSKVCIRCNEREEDTEHIFNCNRNTFDTTEYILDTFAETISEQTKIKKEIIDQWKTSLKLQTKTKWYHLIIVGLIPQELKKQIFI